MPAREQRPLGLWGRGIADTDAVSAFPRVVPTHELVTRPCGARERRIGFAHDGRPRTRLARSAVRVEIHNLFPVREQGPLVFFRHRHPDLDAVSAHQGIEPSQELEVAPYGNLESGVLGAPEVFSGQLRACSAIGVERHELHRRKHALAFTGPHVDVRPDETGVAVEVHVPDGEFVGAGVDAGGTRGEVPVAARNEARVGDDVADVPVAREFLVEAGVDARFAGVGVDGGIRGRRVAPNDAVGDLRVVAAAAVDRGPVGADGAVGERTVVGAAALAGRRLVVDDDAVVERRAVGAAAARGGTTGPVVDDAAAGGRSVVDAAARPGGRVFRNGAVRQRCVIGSAAVVGGVAGDGAERRRTAVDAAAVGRGRVVRDGTPGQHHGTSVGAAAGTGGGVAGNDAVLQRGAAAAASVVAAPRVGGVAGDGAVDQHAPVGPAAGTAAGVAGKGASRQRRPAGAAAPGRGGVAGHRAVDQRPVVGPAAVFARVPGERAALQNAVGRASSVGCRRVARDDAVPERPVERATAVFLQFAFAVRDAVRQREAREDGVGLAGGQAERGAAVGEVPPPLERGIDDRRLRPVDRDNRQRQAVRVRNRLVGAVAHVDERVLRGALDGRLDGRLGRGPGKAVVRVIAGQRIDEKLAGEGRGHEDDVVAPAVADRAPARVLDATYRSLEDGRDGGRHIRLDVAGRGALRRGDRPCLAALHPKRVDAALAGRRRCHVVAARRGHRRALDRLAIRVEYASRQELTGLLRENIVDDFIENGAGVAELADLDFGEIVPDVADAVPAEVDVRVECPRNVAVTVCDGLVAVDADGHRATGVEVREDTPLDDIRCQDLADRIEAGHGVRITEHLGKRLLVHDAGGARAFLVPVHARSDTEIVTELADGLPLRRSETDQKIVRHGSPVIGAA